MINLVIIEKQRLLLEKEQSTIHMQVEEYSITMHELKTIETEHIPIVGDHLINIVEEHTTYKVVERVFSFNKNEVHIYVEILP